MGSSCIWTTRKPWDAQRLLMTGPPSPAPVSSLAPAPPVYQVSSAVQQQTYRNLKWDSAWYLTGLCIVVCSPVHSILSCLQNLSPTTPANQTAACQRPHHLVMCALRVSSAPSSLRHGREAIRQMNPRWTLKSFTSLFTWSALFHLCFFIMVSLSSLLCLNPFLKTFCLQY